MVDVGRSMKGGAVAAESSQVWRRSTRCGESGTCVEVAMPGEQVIVRQSGEPELRVSVSLEVWREFLEGVRRGEFDR
jgi:uncharacterized protein DUF397